MNDEVKSGTICSAFIVPTSALLYAGRVNPQMGP